MTVYFRSPAVVLRRAVHACSRGSRAFRIARTRADFYTLVLGATLGMCLMASANHLLMVFLGVEMASVPSYALAGMLKGRRQSSEAALKYSVYGAGTAGVMLYGISLLAGAAGLVHLPTMAVSWLLPCRTNRSADGQAGADVGGLMVWSGLAFKLSAVPFHFWCPDVFEGASAEVNAFLSVASKAAALALLLRVAIGFGHQGNLEVPTAQTADGPKTMLVADLPTAHGSSLGATVEVKAARLVAASATEPTILDRVRSYLVGLISLIAAVTCTFGNLAAYAQTNIKRLLAYSTIAHAGYMMMPVAAAVALLGRDTAAAEKSVAAVAFYVGVYLFMNLGAFAIVAFMRNAMRSEEIEDYAGLIRHSPGLVICFSIILISLIGLPFFSGFIAKWLAFYALVPAQLYWLLAVGGLNTALSLFYYLRIIKTMTMDPEPHNRLPVDFSMVSAEGAYVALVTLPVVVLGVAWDPLYRWAEAASRQLLN